MEEIQQQPICGFVPPYILEAIAGSDTIAEESRHSCKHTLQHVQSYAEHRHELYTGAHVSSPSTGTGFIPEYILSAIADPKEGAIKEHEASQQTLITADADCRGRSTIAKKLVISLERWSGLALIGSVHYKPKDTPAGYNNAYWDGDAKRMVFGDGDHITFDYLTDSLDVIAHELSHGFVQYTSPLKYQSQSGALNESCADVFGSMVEQWHMRQTVEDADWILGQTLFPVAFTGSALRSLKAGKAYTDDPVFGTDPQPKHMDNIFKGPGDNEGVHINSGIPNHAFYLAAKSLGGNSWEKAGKVWYKTMTSGKIPFQCDFKTFAKVTVEIAGAAFAADASVKNAIRDAWVKVGVLPAAAAE
ncbi:extracellular metalloprotease precursor [Cucurbitaria berberidis CBS 394.84]|uniref:Extracellular metalloprotease n=1 Tax=Cucurbitaria berberidis CBS 394.84 TaxID=1168544 RepID=A0A9P4GL75_9PLEO|nr:extracellular metalloprotease precursor [Cucurbitaria berberidis CBS 394.84]KAF1847697.1 extracellular metalloprotease precursor [Cucurbitaria berberidis CBS 394.84]